MCATQPIVFTEISNVTVEMLRRGLKVRKKNAAAKNFHKFIMEIKMSEIFLSSLNTAANGQRHSALLARGEAWR
ncbi:MAG: hypothetical protein ACTHLA_02610 [Asticcacaulis sp.]|jgi:hypothetical protein|uniref:hypothetical protein n=1 Tax=Asticcacaulis sp. TaxID=1872648 RepID=UPI003F7CBFD6